MKTNKLILLTLITIIGAACSAVKKSATATSTPAPTAIVPETDNYLFTKPATETFVPGDKEVAALQARFKNLTLDQLKLGHQIYTQGACVNCHGAKNIYQLDVTQWDGILDDMAQKANISAAEKDAVYKYVLSIKATQPN